MTSRPPFTHQLDHAKRLAVRGRKLETLRSERASGAALDDARRSYVAALKRSPQDVEIRQNFAELLRQCG